MGAEATDSAYSRDLLRRFVGAAGEGGEGPGELELDLGLSLGGCFSVNPRERRLPRSASLAADHDLAPARGPARTRSLPVAAEERWKRKEVEGEEGAEAKRRRSVERESALRALSQCSVGAQGSGSSGVSDLESRPAQGFEFSGLGSCTEVGSPLTVISSSNNTVQESKTVPKPMVGNSIKAPKEEYNLPKKVARSNGTLAAERNMLEEMPQVHTCGDGPNGQRIEGFLYNYRKGEVRIVCVCHGSFLTPAEFVMHAGGTDVTNPLRHIVVTTSPPAL